MVTDIRPIRGKPTLDGGELFRMYHLDMGTARSLVKVAKYLESKGKTHPTTSRKFTPMAVRWAMLVWEMKNEDAAYQIIQEAAYNQGMFISREAYEKDLQKWVYQYFKKNNRSFEKWLKARKKENLINASSNSSEVVA